MKKMFFVVAFLLATIASSKLHAQVIMSMQGPIQCNGSNDTGTIQNAINSMSTVYLPAGCVVTSQINLNTQTKLIGTASGRSGTPTVYCNVGGGNCFVLYGNGAVMRDVHIEAGNMSGGVAIYVNNVSDTLLDNVYVNNSYNGVFIWGSNNTIIHNSMINLARGQWALRWDYDPGGPGEGDLVTITNSVIACGFNGGATADGIQWDGNTYTMDLTNVPILRCNHGIYMQNSRGSGRYPTFLFADDIQIEGAVSNSIVSVGAEVWITNSYIKNGYGQDGQGNNDGAVISLICQYGPTCGPNYGGSATFIINNSHIFGGATLCFSSNWYSVQIVNSKIELCAMSGNQQAPLIFGANTYDAIVSNSFINGSNANATIYTIPGCQQVLVTANHLYGPGLIDGGGCVYNPQLTKEGNVALASPPPSVPPLRARGIHLQIPADAPKGPDIPYTPPPVAPPPDLVSPTDKLKK